MFSFDPFCFNLYFNFNLTLIYSSESSKELSKSLIIFLITFLMYVYSFKNNFG